MKQIVMVGNTHFDPVWLWRWGEALSSITATFRAALERMEEDPDFCYSFSAPAVLEWIEQTDPDLFLQIKQRVEEGRWDLAEGWWLQADTNSGSAESYVRQGLLAQNYLEDKFGKRAKSAFNIDSFGHSSGLPQILCGCGITQYVFWRPNEEQYSFESPLFQWNGAADTSLLCYRVGGAGGDIFENLSMRQLIEEARDKNVLAVFGVTDHGGAPTKAQIEEVHRYQNEYKDKVNIRFGTVDDFFSLHKGEDMPQHTGEIPVTFIGPYSNMPEVKQKNLQAAQGAQNAETVSLICKNFLQKTYPKEKIRQIWKDVLFNEFHDILGGCCIEDAYEDARNLHGRALANADDIVTLGLSAYTNRICMPGENPKNEWNLVVWNLNTTDFDGEVEAEVQWAWEFPWYRGGISLTDADGNVYPCQMIREYSVMPGFRSRFVFRAHIPSLGYRSFIVNKTDTPAEYCGLIPAKTVENERFCLTVEKNSVVLQDKHTGITYPAFFAPFAVGDICDTWGFNKTVFESNPIPLELESSCITEQGVYFTRLKTVWRYGHSRLDVYFSLYDSAVSVRYCANWQESGVALRLCYRESAPIVSHIAGVPYAQAVRSEKEFECPIHKFLQTDHTVLSFDGPCAYRNFDGALEISVLRNCLIGDLRTQALEEADNPYMGQGITKGNIKIGFDREQTDTFCAMHQNPPRVLVEANHGGDFPTDASFGAISNPLLQVTCLKEAERDEKIVFRVYNPTACLQTGVVTLFGDSVSVSLTAGEIQTFKQENGKYIRCNMLEETE